MTESTKHFLNKLLADLRKNPDIPVHSAVQAVILGSIRMKLATHECKEVLDILRMEYGLSRERFASIVILMVKGLPEEYRGDTRIIIPT